MARHSVMSHLRNAAPARAPRERCGAAPSPPTTSPIPRSRVRMRSRRYTRCGYARKVPCFHRIQRRICAKLDSWIPGHVQSVYPANRLHRGIAYRAAAELGVGDLDVLSDRGARARATRISRVVVGGVAMIIRLE